MMKRPVTSVRGVRDWEQKVAVLRVILNCYTVGDIVDLIYSDDADLAVRTEQKFRTWRSTNPTSKESLEFFDRLAVKMGCIKGTTGIMLVQASIERFIMYLASEDKRDSAFEALDAAGYDGGEMASPAGVRVEGVDGIFPVGPHKPLAKFRSIFVPRRGKLETISSGIRHGRISEKHYYLTPEAALTWNELVNAESYPTYDQCKLGLKALVASHQWEALLKERPVTAAVMLCGGGSPSKDVVLINALLDQPLPDDRTIDYVILDISPYMLLSSVWWLGETLETVSGGERINVITICEDVSTDFDRSVYNSGAGRTLFGITGGTIGNLSETEFLRHIPAETGDLLMVSADSLPGDDPANVRSLIDKYNHREMRKFVSPAVHALIRHFDLQEGFAEAYKRIKVGIADGPLANSDIPGSASVTMSATIDGHEVTLLSSTRYVHDELVKFAARFGWKHVASIPSPANTNFIQFLFIKSV